MDERLLRPDSEGGDSPPTDERLLKPGSHQKKKRGILRNCAFGLPGALQGVLISLNADASQLTFSPVLSPSTVAKAQLCSGVIATMVLLLLGHYADRMRTPWGRRRPLVLLGALGLAASSYLLAFPQLQHTVPAATPGQPQPTLPAAAEARLGSYFTVLCIAKELCKDLLTVSLGAWAAELTNEAGERASLFSCVAAASLALSLVKPMLVVTLGYSTKQLFDALGPVIPALMVASALLVCLTESEPEWATVGSGKRRCLGASGDKGRVMSILPTIRGCMRNRPWLVLVGITVAVDFVVLGMAELGPSLFYIFGITDINQLLQFSSKLGLIALWPGLGMACAAPWILQRLRRRSALKLSLANMALVLLGFLALLCAHAPPIGFVYVLAACIASVNGLLGAVLQIMFADTIDYAELHTGCRQEGVYMSLAQVPGKFIDIALTSLPTISLALCGIKHVMGPGTYPASAGALTALRIWTGVLPTAMALGALALSFRYSLTQTKHDEVVRLLKQRQHDPEARVLDPVGGRPVPHTGIAADAVAAVAGGSEDKSVLEYLRYFSRNDLLAFAHGWQRRWLIKWGTDATLFSAYLVWMLYEGSATYASPRASGGLSAEEHRSLAALQLVVGCSLCFPVGYYLLQLTGLHWVLRQSKEKLLAYVTALGEIDERVQASLLPKRTGVGATLWRLCGVPCGVPGRCCSSAEGAALRVGRHELVKHSCCITLCAILHVYVYQPSL